MDLTQKIVLAAEEGQLEQVKEALKEGASPDAIGHNSGALHCAAQGGHQAIVVALLEAGANPNIPDQQSFYPLHLAASSCASAICRLLLQAEATVDVMTKQQGTPLHVAAATGCSEVVQVLLEHGADIEAKDSYNATPLLVAAAEGKASIVQQLLSAGAEVNVKDKNDETALLKATRRLLQSRGANWETVRSEGTKQTRYQLIKGSFRVTPNYTPSQAATLGTLLPLEQQYQYALESWGPKQHLHYLDALATIQFLLEKNIEVQTINVVGHSAMWMACAAGEAKIMRALYQAGANFEAVEDNDPFKGATCLHKVAASGRLEGLEAYFELHPDYNIVAKDAHGWTPLHYFADMGGHQKIGKLLLKKGANKQAKSLQDRGAGCPEGVLPYQVALHWKDQEAADLLRV